MIKKRKKRRFPSDAVQIINREKATLRLSELKFLVRFKAWLSSPEFEKELEIQREKLKPAFDSSIKACRDAAILNPSFANVSTNFSFL